jgi:hypothetical protein
VTVKTVPAPQFYSRNTAQNPFNIAKLERTSPVLGFAGSPPDGLQFNIPKHSLTFLVFSSKEWL